MQQVANRTIFTRDNLDILLGMDDASIDLVYLDPPFNSKRHYRAAVDSHAAGAAFKDVWTLQDADDAWVDMLRANHPALHALIAAMGEIAGPSDQAYLIYMAVRLLELRRILKPSGSLYLHCDPTMSHSLKLVLDGVFGRRNFRNEIVWGYRTGGVSKRRFPQKHDILLLYGKTAAVTHNPLKQTVLYDRPFFTSAKPDKDGKFPVDVFLRDVWDDAAVKPVINVSKERTGYPTQKPLALMERIITASSNKGDIVLDPFCGCATTCIAAEKLERQWVGIDISPRAAELIKDRMLREVQVGEGSMLYSINHRRDLLARTVNAARGKDSELKPALYGRQGGYCNGCRAHFEMRNMELDHIYPRSRGGQDMDANLQLLCGSCNRIKGNALTMPQLIAENKKRGFWRGTD